MFWFGRRLPSEMRTAAPLTSHSRVDNAGKEILAEQTTVSTHSNTEDRQPLSVQPQQMDNVMDSSDTTGGYLVWLSHHNYIITIITALLSCCAVFVLMLLLVCCKRWRNLAITCIPY